MQVKTYLIPIFNQPAPEVCNSQSLESKANTPGADENEENSNSGEIKDGGSGQDADNISANQINSDKSKYKLAREATLLQNKKFILELGLQFGWEDKTDEVTEKKAKAKKKDAKKEVQAPIRTSARLRQRYS